MMNPEIKKRWLQALRSGEYKQTTGRLHDKDGFCCLGVLCDIVKDELNLTWKFKENRRNAKIANSESMTLPKSVQDYCGLTEWNPEVIFMEVTSDLSYINDCGNTFLEIANLIEEQL